jgi:hypothetical protein
MRIGFFAVGIGATVEPQLVRAVAIAAERLGFATRSSCAAGPATRPRSSPEWSR